MCTGTSMILVSCCQQGSIHTDSNRINLNIQSFEKHAIAQLCTLALMQTTPVRSPGDLRALKRVKVVSFSSKALALQI